MPGRVPPSVTTSSRGTGRADPSARRWEVAPATAEECGERGTPLCSPIGSPQRNHSSCLSAALQQLPSTPPLESDASMRRSSPGGKTRHERHPRAGMRMRTPHLDWHGLRRLRRASDACMQPQEIGKEKKWETMWI
eukprot:363549-Chlamydomonas_euryale.AAC.9